MRISGVRAALFVVDAFVALTAVAGGIALISATRVATSTSRDRPIGSGRLR